MGEDYRVRLDDVERHLIVEALAAHLVKRVRAARRPCDITREGELLQRLATPKAQKPAQPYWARYWSTTNKRDIYQRIRELVDRSKGTVKPAVDVHG